MRVRLLNSSIYSVTPGSRDPMDNPDSYPVIVTASKLDMHGIECSGRVHVTYEELDRVFPIPGYSRGSSCKGDGIGWWNNPPKLVNDKLISWEPVSPFDYWNKLKSSREVGDVVPVGYL